MLKCFITKPTKQNATLCPNCVSGENGCAPRPTCWVEGQCEGRFLHLGQSDTKEDCLNLCKNNPECQWFTWDSRDEACLLFRDCPSINPSFWSASADREIAQLVILIATYNLDIFIRLDNWKKKLIFRLVSLSDY